MNVTPAPVVPPSYASKPFGAAPAQTGPKKTLAEVMAEERVRSQEEAVQREMREAEEETERKQRVAAASWGSGLSSNPAPTLREIMEAEAKQERSQRSQMTTSSFAANAVAVPAQERSGGGWGPWAASNAAKSLREIQAEEEGHKSTAKPNNSGPTYASQFQQQQPQQQSQQQQQQQQKQKQQQEADDDFFWGQGSSSKSSAPPTVSASDEAFPALPGAKPKAVKSGLPAGTATAASKVAGNKGPAAPPAAVSVVKKTAQAPAPAAAASPTSKKGKKKMERVDPGLLGFKTPDAQSEGW